MNPLNKPHIRSIEPSTVSNTVAVEVTCPVCRITKEYVYPLEEFEMYREGLLIKHAMPDVDNSDREALVSGTCETCFEKVFGGNEE